MVTCTINVVDTLMDVFCNDIQEMQAIEELYRLQQHEDDVCCDQHKCIYKEILLRLTLLNDPNDIMKFADEEWCLLVSKLNVNKNIVNRLLKQYHETLCKSYFASWKSFTKAMVSRKRLSSWLNKRQIFSLARCYKAWKLETKRRVLLRGELCVSEAMLNVKANILDEISRKESIHEEYNLEVEKLVQSRRELDHDVHQLQMNLDNISRKLAEKKEEYDTHTHMRRQKENVYKQKIEKLKQLIETEEMAASDYEALINEKKDLLSPPLKKKRNRGKRGKKKK